MALFALLGVLRRFLALTKRDRKAYVLYAAVDAPEHFPGEKGYYMAGH